LVILTPEAYWGAYPVLVYLSISAVFMGSTQLTALGISISKKTRIFIYTSWGAAILNCVLNLFFIKLFGAQGAAISTCITYFFLTASYLYFSKKLIGLHFNNRQIVALLLLMFLVSALGLFLNQFNLNLWMSLLIKSGIYIGIVLLCFVAKILQINQLKATLAMLGAKFGKKENGDQ
jgi:O-antigen/teichoic acid export membrane protein